MSKEKAVLIEALKAAWYFQEKAVRLDRMCGSGMLASDPAFSVRTNAVIEASAMYFDVVPWELGSIQTKET